jgi:branched-chain amino acid transport system substrate-binding protein
MLRVKAVTAILMLFALGACSERGTNEMRVGVILSLSGAAAPYGQDNRHGLELAVDSLNRAGGIGGHQVALDIRDDAGDQAQAVTALRRFAEDTSIAIVLGPTRTGATVAAARLLPELRIPMISVGSTGDWRAASGAEFNAYTFRTTRTDARLILPLLAFARDSLKVHRVALFSTVDDDWSRSLVPLYLHQADSLGIVVTDTLTQKTGDLDRTPQLTRVRRSAPDALIINTLSTDAPTIATQARRLGITGQLLGTAGFSNPQTWKLADPGALEGAILAENYYAASARPAVRAFVNAYRAKFGADAPPYAAYAWDAMMLLADACRRVGGECRDREALRTALGATANFEAVLGTLTYHDAGDAEKAPVILDIRGGQYVQRGAHDGASAKRR